MSEIGVDIPQSIEPQGDEAPQAIFVLGGGNRVIEKGGRETKFTTSPYKGKFYPEKTGGAKARPYAVLQLAEEYPGTTIVTLSQRPGHLAKDSVSPSFASVMAGDMVDHGIDGERIIEQPASTSTLTEIMEVIKMSASNDWSRVDVVASDYQVKRGQLLLDILMDPVKYTELKNKLASLFLNSTEMDIFEAKMSELEQAIEKFRATNSSADFVSAEDVLLRRSKHHANLVNYVRGLEGYDNVQKQEAEMNERIEAGEYNFAQPTFREYIMSLH